MKISIKIHTAELQKDSFFRAIYQIIKENRWKWQSIAAIVTLPGGVVSSIIGSLLNFTTLFIPASQSSQLLSKTSVFCFVITLPLLLIGSHCLDLLEKQTSVMQCL